MLTDDTVRADTPKSTSGERRVRRAGSVGRSASRSPSRRCTWSSGRRRPEASTSQSTYSAGPAAGSPRHAWRTASTNSPAHRCASSSVQVAAGRCPPRQVARMLQRRLARNPLEDDRSLGVAPARNRIAIGRARSRAGSVGEPHRQLGRGQPTLGVAQAGLRPCPGDLDLRIVRVHRPGQIEVAQRDRSRARSGTCSPAHCGPARRLGRAQGLLGQAQRLRRVGVLLAGTPRPA